MKGCRSSAMVLLAWLLTSCSTAVSIEDARPAQVAQSQLLSTIWIAQPTPGGIKGYGSAVVVDANHLLTNAHVWCPADGEAWRQRANLPAARELGFLKPTGDPQRDTPVPGQLPGLGLAPFTLVAAGETSEESWQAAKGDWVLIRTEQPWWSPAQVPAVRQSNGGWSGLAGEGADVLVAGFSSIFMGDGQGGKIEGGSIAWSTIRDFVGAGPYTIAGRAIEIRDQPAITYPADWPRPGGHSGGGVYVWNGSQRRPELVGIFSSRVSVRVTRRAQVAPLGLTALAYERDVEEDGWVLQFAALPAEALALLAPPPAH